MSEGKMDCKEVREKLSSYQDGETVKSVTQEISEHLKNCKECNAEFIEMQELIKGLQTIPAKEISPYFTQKLMSRIKEKKKNSFDWSFGFASLVYSLIFIFFLSFGFIVIENDKESTVKSEITTNEVYLSKLLANNQKLNLIHLQDNIINIIEEEVKR